MKKKYYSNLFLFVLLVQIFFACNSPKSYENLAEPQADEDYVVTISTTHGDMIVLLHDDTPLHKRNFVTLIKKGFYEDLLFHRIVPDFVIQGGDPQSRGASAEQRLGKGDPGYTIPAEIRPHLRHEKGALAAARQGNAQNPYKASNGSQFYIVQGKKHTEGELNKIRTDYDKVQVYFQEFMKTPKYAELRDAYNKLYEQGQNDALQEIVQKVIPLMEQEFQIQLTKPYTPAELEYYLSRPCAPSLDGEYTVFGKVIKGLEVIDKIAAEEASLERPHTDIKMNMNLEVLKKYQISQKYGYIYPQKN